MIQITVGIDGMMCGMCEAHINDALRKAFPKIKKVTSSHSKGESVILTEEDISEEEIRQVIDPTGYKVTGVKKGEPAKKRGLFSFGRH